MYAEVAINRVLVIGVPTIGPAHKAAGQWLARWSQETNMNDINETVLKEFLEAFEEVFDKDWAYTKEMLGIYEETMDQKESAKAMGLETIPIISEDGTFINPKVDDETENWGNRGHLLQLYRELRKIVKVDSLAPRK